MAQLHETGYGRKLLEHDIPEINRQLKRIADSLEYLLDQIKEKKESEKKSETEKDK